MKNSIGIAAISAILAIGAQGALVLEYDAADLYPAGNASGMVWAPAVSNGVAGMNFLLGPGSSVITPSSAYFSRSVNTPNAGNVKSFAVAGYGSSATADFSFELWVKPVDLSGSHILFETGGSTIGTSILLIDDTLHFRHSSGGSLVAGVTGVLASTPSDFIQVVGVIDVSAGLALYVNGAPVNSASAMVGTWAGNNGGQFGGTDGNVTKPVGFSPTKYDGELAWARFYDSALTSSEIAALYAANVTDIDVPTGLSASSGDGYVSLDWDDNVQDIFDYFTLYRSTTSGSGYSVITNLTTSAYVDSTVTNGMTYYYVVNATDTNGITSRYSAVVAAASFTPSTEDGLIVHLDASLTGTVLVDGSGHVSSWIDLTGSGNDAVPTAGDLPTTFPSANPSNLGLAGVDSDSSGGSGSLARMDLFGLAAQDSWLDFTGSASGNSGFAILVALQCDSFLGGILRDVVLGNEGNFIDPKNQLIMRCESGVMKVSLNGKKIESGNNLIEGKTVVLALNYDAATGEAVLWDSFNDMPVTGYVPATDFSGVGTMRLFGAFNDDQGMDGMIGEVKIYSKLLDASRFVAEREALKAKWAGDFVVAPTVPAWKTFDALLAWSPETDPDAAFYKSGVPLQDRFWVPEAMKANSNAKTGQGGIQSLDLYNGYPTGNPVMGELGSSRYTFTYWQYLDESVYWGGISSVGIIIPPSPEMIDNAHRNGVPILGNISFFPTVYGGNYQWVKDLIQKSGTTYPAADKLIEVAEYFGFDGWFINQETAGGTAADAADMRDLIKYVRDNSDIRISWYDSMTESGPISWQNRLNTANDWYMRYPENSGGNLISDSMFLNFWWYTPSSTYLQDSRTRANALGLDPYKLYAGLDTQAREFKTTNFTITYAFPDGADHVTSLGLYRPDDNASSLEDQDLFWSGSSGDPRDTTTPVGTGNWRGIAHNVAARSPINSLPFATDFCLGRGTKYFIDGEQVWNKTWWNRSMQAILPTWRWIIDSAGTALTPEINLTDAFQGGSHLRVSGELDAENILQLYLMDLPVSADTQLKIVFKRGTGSTSGADAQMDVGVSLAGDPTSFTYYDVGGYTTGWNEAVIDLGALSGENMAALSLRFTGTATSYEMRVGMISIYNSSDPAPSPPGHIVELAVGLRVDEADGRVAWDHAPGDVYCYNVYIRNVNGSLSYVGSTANNYFYFGRIPYTGDFSSVVVETVDRSFARSVLSDEIVRPVLWADLNGGNFKLSWLQGSGLFSVESRGNLVQGVWTEVTGATVVEDNGTNYVELLIGTDPQLFYRLKK